ncbi:DUF58 domain-containing protein [Halobacteriales archaeon Cl-PHB]
MSETDPPWAAAAEAGTPWPNVAGASPSLVRRVALVVGVVALVAAVVGVAAPGVFAGLGLTGSLLFLAALAGLVLASMTGFRRFRRGERAATFPVVETRADVDRPGATFDEALEGAAALRTSNTFTGDAVGRRKRARRRVTDRLADVAERVVAHRDPVDPETARTAVASGDWTADDAAASLLVDEAAESATDRVSACPAVDSPADSSIERRLAGLATDRTDFRAAVTRATASLAAGVPGVDADGLSPTRQSAPRDEEWAAGVWETEHWRGLGAIGLFVVAIAALANAPTLGLVAAILVGYAGYAWLLDPPAPALSVERTLSPTDPAPGEAVTVSVTARNDGDAWLPDVRLVDGVPDRLSVVDGAARHATALAPGEETTFSYAVQAVAGSHTFDDLSVATRDPSGERERTQTVSTASASLTCEPAAVTASVPLHPQTSGVVGRVPADEGGTGTAFHGVREYRRGDPLRRVDWNRKARTGDLGTLEFEEEHAATVVVLVDVRPEAALAASPEALSAVDSGLGGASRTLETLLGDGDQVGLATLGLDWEYLSPATGGAHRAAMTDLLATQAVSDAAGRGYSFNPARYRRRLARRLPGDAQVVLFSPLCDDVPADLATWLHARGHGVTVFSPDPTATGTLGGTLAAIDRTLRLSALRAGGVRVVDWPADDPLHAAVRRAQARWSR